MMEFVIGFVFGAVAVIGLQRLIAASEARTNNRARDVTPSAADGVCIDVIMTEDQGIVCDHPRLGHFATIERVDRPPPWIMPEYKLRMCNYDDKYEYTTKSYSSLSAAENAVILIAKELLEEKAKADRAALGPNGG
jgi:hypothetical protein